MILDAETDALFKVAGILSPMMLLKQTGILTLGNEAPLRPEVEAWFRGRLEMFQAGLDRCPKKFKKRLERFDPNLRVRWDFYKHWWVIEHYSKFDGLYHTCGSWSGPLDERLINELRKSDMRRKSADEHIKEEHDRADETQRRNDAAVNDELYGVIDGMTRRQVVQFVEASEAIAHGEDIIPMGEDAAFMQRLHDKNVELQHKGMEVPDNPEQCINPGMKPGRYVRQRRDS